MYVMGVNVTRCAELVHPVFVANDWRWANAPTIGGFNVPTVENIEDTLADMIMELQAHSSNTEPGDHRVIGTGRLRVIREHYDHGVEYTACLELGSGLDEVRDDED